jgi:hypothetical protein
MRSFISALFLIGIATALDCVVFDGAHLFSIGQQAKYRADHFARYMHNLIVRVI